MKVYEVVITCDLCKTEQKLGESPVPVSAQTKLPAGWARGVVGKTVTNVRICPACVKALK